jgi:glyoxylase-like metal-dependent hydrolase (beta-lactamase superfamily II)
MTIKSFTFNPFQTNCYVCHSAGEAVLIDASSSTDSEHAAIQAYLHEQGLEVRRTLLTHGHIDHILGCVAMSEAFGRLFEIHLEDGPLANAAVEQGRMFGIELPAPALSPDFLEAGQTIQFGNAALDVLHTPGHSPGSVSFYSREEDVVFAGDVLFSGSIGRTDLWRSSLTTLMTSIFQTLVPLGDQVRVFPGHGPPTTIGQERRFNPFLTGNMPGPS